MWWLPVLCWGLLFAAVLLCAWLSIATDRYYAKVERAQLFMKEIPEEPWYVKISWRRFKKRQE